MVSAFPKAPRQRKIGGRLKRIAKMPKLERNLLMLLAQIAPAV
jgi:hypothetical protein